MADVADTDSADINMVEGDINGDRAVQTLKDKVKKRKGRGFATNGSSREKISEYESMDHDATNVTGPQRSVEGWILFVSGLHEEAQEDDVFDKFSEYGEIKNLHLNLDRRTGFIKGYALVEYQTFKEAETALEALNGSTILEEEIHVDWAFIKGPPNATRGYRRENRSSRRENRSSRRRRR